MRIYNLIGAAREAAQDAARRDGLPYAIWRRRTPGTPGRFDYLVTCERFPNSDYFPGGRPLWAFAARVTAEGTFQTSEECAR